MFAFRWLKNIASRDTFTVWILFMSYPHSSPPSSSRPPMQIWHLSWRLINVDYEYQLNPNHKCQNDGLPTQASELLRATLRMLLAELPPSLPLLLLATAPCTPDGLDPDAAAMFPPHQTMIIAAPNARQRSNFFAATCQVLMPQYRQCCRGNYSMCVWRIIMGVARS